MQMTNQQQQQYDRGITIFSPDGRLFQVEYAKEAVKKGATALGVVYNEGVVLAATRSTPELQVRNPEKVFKIDEHIGVATSGLVADGRTLVEEARNEAQKHMMTYDEEIPTSVLAKFIADRCQHFTQYGGVRPYGLSTISGWQPDGLPHRPLRNTQPVESNRDRQGKRRRQRTSRGELGRGTGRRRSNRPRSDSAQAGRRRHRT
jgi:proteasome alpha subunit